MYFGFLVPGVMTTPIGALSSPSSMAARMPAQKSLIHVQVTGVPGVPRVRRKRPGPRTQIRQPAQRSRFARGHQKRRPLPEIESLSGLQRNQISFFALPPAGQVEKPKAATAPQRENPFGTSVGVPAESTQGPRTRHRTGSSWLTGSGDWESGPCPLWVKSGHHSTLCRPALPRNFVVAKALAVKL